MCKQTRFFTSAIPVQNLVGTVLAQYFHNLLTHGDEMDATPHRSFQENK